MQPRKVDKENRDVRLVKPIKPNIKRAGGEYNRSACILIQWLSTLNCCGLQPRQTHMHRHNHIHIQKYTYRGISGCTHSHLTCVQTNTVPKWPQQPNVALYHLHVCKCHSSSRELHTTWREITRSQEAAKEWGGTETLPSLTVDTAFLWFEHPTQKYILLEVGDTASIHKRLAVIRGSLLCSEVPHGARDGSSPVSRVPYKPHQLPHSHPPIYTPTTYVCAHPRTQMLTNSPTHT